MTKFVVRVGCWALVTFAIAILPAWLSYSYLFAQRYPRESMADAYLRQRLGEMTRAQKATVHEAAKRDPLGAMLAVANAQQQDRSGYEAVAQLGTKQPLPEVRRVERLALNAALAGELSRPDAARFVNSTLSFWAILHDADPKAAAVYLDAVDRASPEEYPAVANDPAYPLIQCGHGLLTQEAKTFRDNQAFLTPVLASADPEDWQNLIEQFERAQPRVMEILADPKLGRAYALVYMLQSDLIQPLVKAGLSETDAINFVGANGAVLRDFMKSHDDWQALVLKLSDTVGPQNQSLLKAASADPAIFWLPTHAAIQQRDDAFKILSGYAGTELPAVLLKYGGDPKLLAAAIDALGRFDNPDDPNPAKRQTAAKFLSRYQDDKAFKEALVEHGAVLIPALSCGGRDALAQIRKNPGDITKWVDVTGKPRKTPLWTWIPGGNIVFAVGEKVHGRTVTWGELGWATVDVVLLVPVVGEAAMATRAAVVSERAGAEALVETAAATAARDTEQVVIEEAAGGVVKGGGEEMVVETVRSSAQIGSTLEARTLLKAAGAKVVGGFKETLRIMVNFAKSHPLISSAATIGVLLAIYPEDSPIGKKLRQILLDAARGTAKTVAAVAAAVPGSAIEGLWDEVQSLIKRRPMLAPLYYALLVVLMLWMILVPLYLLKRFLRPLYLFLVAPLVAVSRGLARYIGLNSRPSSTVPMK